MFSALSRFGRAGAPAGRSLEAAVRSLLPDVWYDPSSMETLYQDSAGTTPVTAVEQAVGLMLDKSRGLVLGPELVTNGTFDANIIGWTKGTGTTSPLSWDGTGQRLVVTNDSAYFASAFQVISGLTVGKAYKVSATCSNNTVTTRLSFVGFSASGASASANPSGSAALSFVFFASATSHSVEVVNTQNTLNGVSYWDNISVRELPGNHAYHTPGDTTTRPVLKTGNLLNFDGANDAMVASSGGGATSGFMFVSAIKLKGASKTQTVFSDTGTNTGFRVRVNSSNQLEISAGNGSAYTTAATTDTLSIDATAVIAAWHDGTNLNVQVNNGTVAQQAFATASAGTTGFTIGRDNGALSSFLQAQVCASVYAKKAVTESQIAAAKRYCAQKAGVTL